MKKCSYCGKEYPDDALICTVDQQPLQEVHPPFLKRPAPTPLPASSGDTQRIIDDEHLKMLSIFHYVLAGFAFVGLLFICLHFLFMAAIFTSPGIFNSSKNQSPPPVEVIIPVLAVFYFVFGGMLLAAAVGNLLSANFLRQRTHRTFSLVVAGLDCLHIPFGTALGIFTIMVLNRPSVDAQYRS